MAKNPSTLHLPPAITSKSSQRRFSGSGALQVALPMGGIGAGCICLNGHGGLQDFSIRNKPALTATADGHTNGDAAFGILHVKGKRPQTRLLEGPMPAEKIYNLGLQGQGHRKGGHEGLPRMDHAECIGEYPFLRVDMKDEEIPLTVTLTGWSPFIPLDDRNSSLPCAVLEYAFRNTSKSRVEFSFSYHLEHLAYGKTQGNSRNAAVPGKGFFHCNIEKPGEESFGSSALFIWGHTPEIKAMWYRAGWWDVINAIWKEATDDGFSANADSGEGLNGRNGGSVKFSATLAAGEEITYPLIVAWHFPNCNVVAGQAPKPKQECSGPNCCPPKSDEPAPAWRPYYAGQFANAQEVAEHVHRNFAELREKTLAFKNALFSSTLPDFVLDAVSANLGIIKSPTLLRQENGNLWGWEGCFANYGCCHGSCTHVWNYAQALPHLFPQLERTFREQELERSMFEDGYVKFRSALPDGPTTRDFHPAADGQLGGILKVYRDWQICGDDAWLRKMYPLAKRSLDFCIRHWDPDQKGALFEPHHNTYDIEFWGPDGMCTSIYLGALCAAAKMARAVGPQNDALVYEDLAKKGAKYMDAELFNGEYYFQKTMYKNLRDQSFMEKISKPAAKGDAALEVRKREGPDHQYGNGVLSDGVIGCWMSAIYGVELPLNKEKVRSTLKSIFRYNWREDLFRHANTQRPGYAMGHEPGLLVCTWPKGDKPTAPFPYSDEVWTGMEYQVASHCIEEGLVKEGLAIVEAARQRHDGRTRNPWNEYECGNYYARAMSSFAVLNSLSGFRYSAPEKKLFFAPKLSQRPFKAFFSTQSGYGTISLDRKTLTIEMLGGRLEVNALVLTDGKNVRELSPKIVASLGEPAFVALK
ncbi:MAG TPA: GH116 family glycosyl hydrolase [Planctomycetota bacterium]|nr:GH116 family glycosyl hydrolase [Planctomycetota bacterium]